MRIYVACLASYNAGTLHGAWIDIEGLNQDEILEEIQTQVLLTSPNPNVEVMIDGEAVPSAEEWVIHGYDGIPSHFGEYPDLEELITYCEGYAEQGDAWKAYVEYFSFEPSLADFEERYQGEYSNPTDWAEHFIDETDGLSGMPENLRYYFDYEAYARDAEMSGDLTFCQESHSTCYVFWNH